MDDTYKPIGVPTTLLEEQGEAEVGAFDHKFNNVSLKSGAILACYEIEDDENVTKLGPEYDVMVIEQRQDQGQAGTVYKNCLAPDAFGSIADFMEFKRRVPTQMKEYKDTLDTDVMNGSFVLLLCLDGQSEKAIIMGGLKNPNRPDTLTKEAGQHMEWEFNGVNFVVKDDGSFKIEYKSKSDNDGKYADEEAGGSFIEIDASGQITIANGDATKNKERIVINKTDKTIDITAEKDITLTTEANVNVNTTKSLNIKTMADIIASAEGKAAITSNSTINVEAKSQIEIKSPTQKFTADSMFTVESNLVNIKGQIVMLGQGGPPALTLLTLFLGTGNLGAPVISQAIGPFSANVFYS